MQNKPRKLAMRFMVALLTFTTGVAVTTLWVVPHFRRVTTPNALKVADTLGQRELSLPDAWRRLEVRNEVALSVPQDMKPIGALGDSLRYREAYGNRNISITIVYDVLLPELLDESQRQRLYSCETATSDFEKPSYHESFIEIDGRRAKLGIDRSLPANAISANLCFAGDDVETPLRVVAICKNDRALETAQQIFASIRFKDNK